MSHIRRSRVVATLLKLTGDGRSASVSGPGCTCESCVRAWKRNHPIEVKARDFRRFRPGLY